MSTYRIQFTVRKEVPFVKMRQAFWMIALALLSSVVLRAAPVSAQVFSVTGTVECKASDASGYAPLKKGQVIAIGSTIRTGDDGTAVLVVTKGSAIQIGNGSILKLNDLGYAASGGAVTERKATLQLTSGVVSALIDPSTPKVTDFKIQTPQGAAAARGTFYAVLVYHGKTYVGVKEGKVAATAAGQ